MLALPRESPPNRRGQLYGERDSLGRGHRSWPRAHRWTSSAFTYMGRKDLVTMLPSAAAIEFIDFMRSR